MKLIVKIFLFISFVGNAQNFNNIPNYSFENVDTCELSYMFSHLLNWYNPTNLGTPDAYLKCADDIMPHTINDRKRHSGYNRVGLFTYDITYANSREYVAIQLKQSLISSKKYCSEFYLIPAKNFKYGSNDFGIYFGYGNQYYIANYNITTATPQLTLPLGTFINDTANWYHFTGIYTAQGGESDIVLGSFKNDSQISLQIIDTSSMAPLISYFVIDDVSLHEMTINSGDTAVTCPQNMIATIGEVNQDTAFKSYWWYDASGALIDSINSQIQVQPTNSTFYIQEKRMCGQSLWDTVYVEIDTVCPPAPPEPPVVETEFVIPNVFSPNGDDINDVWKVDLSTKELESYVIYNRWGIEIYNSENTTYLTAYTSFIWDGRTMSGIECSDGVYYYTIQLKNTKGEIEKYRGYITLMR